MTPSELRAKAKALRKEAASLDAEAEAAQRREDISRIAARPPETATPIPLADLVVGEFYRAVGCDQTVPGEDFPFVLSLDHAANARAVGLPVAPAVWGFSVYRRQPGYRTLGTDFTTWAAQPANAKMLVYRDRNRCKDTHPASPIYARYA